MRTIIAGSRSITNYDLVENYIETAPWRPAVVISGDAAGVDTLAARWAEAKGIKVEHYPAEWDRYGRRAGFIRNSRMADVAEALLLIWDGKSPGSAMMKKIAAAKGLAIHEIVV